MNQISDMPNVYPAGSTFNYAVWGANTSVTLCNVPWTSDYRDIVKFDSPAKLNDYLTDNSGPTVVLTKMSYARVGEPIRIPLPFNDAYKYNYIRVNNPRQPVGESTGRSFYYFITSVTHLAPNTTQLTIQLDVWQTFGWDIKMGRAYIERGHVGIAENNSFDQYGRELLAQPEGFDLGNEYQIIDVNRHTIADLNYNSPNSLDILLFSNIDLTGDMGSIQKPNLVTASGTDLGGIPCAMDVYYFHDVNELTNFLGTLSKYPWAAQGIISIIGVPANLIEPSNYTNTSFFGLYSDAYPVKKITDLAVQRRSGFPHGYAETTDKYPIRDIVMAKDFRSAFRNNAQSNRYKYLDKFQTYPYSAIELTTNTGTPLVLKPECINSSDLTVRQLASFAPPNQRLAYFPLKYNASDGSAEWADDVDDGGEFMDMMTGIFNFPTFATVNNSYVAFMASNANNIAYQYSSADWSQARALQGVETSFGQASSSISAEHQQNAHTMNAASQQMNIANDAMAGKAIVGMVSGIGTGALAGGAAGATMGAAGAIGKGIDAAISMNANQHSTAVSNQLSQNRTNTSVSNASYVRDTNKEYGEFAARGDYSNAIAGINARVQDAKLLQPTTSGQMGGDAFSLAVYKWAIVARMKMISPGARASIGEYWLRYGYAINRFAMMPANLMVMDRFTFWKVKELYLRSSECPETFRQTIRGIFEKGVTVWKNPDHIGVTDWAINNPIKGNYLNG